MTPSDGKIDRGSSQSQPCADAGPNSPRSPEADFVCAVCQRDICMRWNVGSMAARTVPPVCLYCEGEYTRGVRSPSHGAFRDRREVMRGLAIAEALRCEAARKTWGAQYGCA